MGFSILGAMHPMEIPIQPEGNTRQIQEFDKLFIRLSKTTSILQQEILSQPASWLFYELL